MRKVLFICFDEIALMENLCEAWQEFILGKRKKKDVQEFALRLGDEIANLHLDLMNGTYCHGAYSHFRINDPKPREIHKATVRDRLLHHAIHRKLYPFFANLFISDSFSCQKTKGLHRALERFEKLSRKASQNDAKTCWVLKCDIRKFFASINHQILLEILARRIADRRLLDLLRCVISSFQTRPGKGIPLGNLTSQIFANIYMNEFDRYVKHELKAKYYARYADDFIFISRDRQELLEYLPKIAAFLAGPLELELHPNKVFIKTLASGVDFLGWVHFPHHLVPRQKTKSRILKRVKQSPNAQTVASYVGLLSHGNAHDLSEKILNITWLISDK
ncbi:hypothetical protein GF391_00800 [Candidatus Uhrbacteria bacterium]|nr:hypothetical protein [Candidatus Uhrbacteria bacterium]